MENWPIETQGGLFQETQIPEYTSLTRSCWNKVPVLELKKMFQVKQYLSLYKFTRSLIPSS